MVGLVGASVRHTLVPVGILGVPLETEVSVLPIVFQRPDTRRFVLADHTPIQLTSPDAVDDQSAYYPLPLDRGPEDTHVMVFGTDLLARTPDPCRALLQPLYPQPTRWGAMAIGTLDALARLRERSQQALLRLDLSHVDALAAAEIATAVGPSHDAAWARLYLLSDRSPRILENYAFLRNEEPEHARLHLEAVNDGWQAGRVRLRRALRPLRTSTHRESHP